MPTLKHFCICLILILPSISMAQETLDQEERLFGGNAYNAQKIELGASYFYKSTRFNSSSSITIDSLLFPSYQDNFDVSLDVKIPISSKIAIKTGILFALDAVTYDDFSITFPSDSDGNGGVDVRNSSLRHYTEMRYVGIPINVHFYFSEEQPFYLKTGADFLMRVDFSGYNTYDIGGNPGQLGFIEAPENKFQTKLNGAIGYEYRLDKMTFLLEATAKMETATTNHGPLVSYRKYFLGASAGVLF